MSFFVFFTFALNRFSEIGDDVKLDELVLQKNIRLGPAELGILATVGLRTVRVYDKPRVVVLSTGNEVI